MHLLKLGYLQMLRANRHGSMNVPELFDIALSTLNALVYLMTNTTCINWHIQLWGKTLFCFLRPHNVEIWCMNETYNDKTLIQYVVMYATLPSTYLGMYDCRIYCKTKQTACISYYLHRYTSFLENFCSHDRIRDKRHSWVFPIDSSA